MTPEVVQPEDISIHELVDEESAAVRDFILKVMRQLGLETKVEHIGDLLDLDDFYIKPGGAFFVLKSGKSILGTVGVKKNGEDGAEIRRLFVEEEYRGRGLGKKLLEMAEGFCREKGFKKVKVDLDGSVQDAEKLLNANEERVILL
jgi:GNAT superfamily N-acetyltransferase